jgi:hypothetical protein
VRLQAFAGIALYLYLPENILQMAEFVGQIAAFLCCSCLDLLRLVKAVLDWCSGKQNFKCRDGGRQFVMTPRHQPISSATKELIDRRLLLEKISLAGIVRATGVSEPG